VKSPEISRQPDVEAAVQIIEASNAAALKATTEAQAQVKAATKPAKKVQATTAKKRVLAFDLGEDVDTVLNNDDDEVIESKSCIGASDDESDEDAGVDMDDDMELEASDDAESDDAEDDFDAKFNEVLSSLKKQSTAPRRK
jgi:hypothetical protein